MSKELTVGDKAPDFELPSTIGDKVKLSDEIGDKSILLLFYPFNWSSGCTKEMCSIRDGLTEFSNLNAKVFGISVDSPYAHKAWTKELELKFPLLSDFNKEVIKSYGIMHESYKGLKGFAKRSVFIIDKKGIIRYKWVSDDPGKLPDLDEVKNDLKNIV